MLATILYAWSPQGQKCLVQNPDAAFLCDIVFPEFQHGQDVLGIFEVL